MSRSHFTISPADSVTASSRAFVTAAGFAGATDASRAAQGGMPLMIPAAQTYFWSRRWQDQEREFERDRAAGELVKANSMLEVMHDLMRLDD